MSKEFDDIWAMIEGIRLLQVKCSNWQAGHDATCNAGRISQGTHNRETREALKALEARLDKLEKSIVKWAVMAAAGGSSAWAAVDILGVLP